MDEIEKIAAGIVGKNLLTLIWKAIMGAVGKLLKRPSRPEPTGSVEDPHFPERRHGLMEKRLRTGIWYEFHRKTGLGKTELLDLSDSDKRDQLIEATILESERYEITDRTTGDRVKAADAVKRVVELACQDWKKLRSKDRVASASAKCMADRLIADFDVHQRARGASGGR